MPENSALLPLGWNDHWSALLPEHTCPARVLRHDGAALLVAADDGVRSIGLSTRLDPEPTVGDWLALGDDDMALAVLPRDSLLQRRDVDDDRGQALAANVDIVLITCGLDRPVKPRRLDRSITIARDAGATPIIVLTKSAADVAALDPATIDIEHPDIRIIVTSALEGVGIDELREVIAGSTAVLLGESGAGKSTLTNALLGWDAAATGTVRDGDAKGRHTTSSRQLHVLNGSGGGVVIDTPGIRAVGLWTDSDAVDATFADIQALAETCRFSDCRHETEPGCAVQQALADGELSGERHAAWRRLRREVEAAALRAAPREYRKRNKQFARYAKEGEARKRP